MFKVNELLRATAGKLIQGKPDTTIRGISIDSRTINPQEAFIAIRGDKYDGHDFIDEAIKKGASCVIAMSPKVVKENRKVTFIEVKNTINALGDIAQFQRRKFDIPLIAITGSNGKTTAKEMIAWVLSKRLRVLKNEGTKNNQIGLPLTLLNLNRYYDIVVLEIGTNHPGEIEYLARISQPNIGIITNIGPSHLEYLHNLKSVFKEKYKLIENLKKPYIAILNADDSLLRRQLLKKTKRPFILGVGIKNQSDFFASDIKILNGKIEFLVNGVKRKYKFTPLETQNKQKEKTTPLTAFKLKTLGYYNIYNALVAITVARLFGIEYKDIASSLANFDFPQSRLKFIKLNNMKFIDDTYNSNPASLRQALNTLDNFRTKGRKIFVMGDMLELGRGERLFHYQAGKEAVRVCDVIITVGRLSKLAAKAAKSCDFDIKNIFICESCSQARQILFNKISLKEDDIVLVKGSRAMKMEEIFK